MTLYNDGKDANSVFQSIPLDHAQWFSLRMKGLSLEQVKRAFEAAQVKEPLLTQFATAVHNRVQGFVHAIPQ
ncbi:MAG: hypothetical protein AB7F59_00160 [Bdellovibrionales bacterium]